jgi:hypothetical protein
MQRVADGYEEIPLRKVLSSLVLVRISPRKLPLRALVVATMTARTLVYTYHIPVY